MITKTDLQHFAPADDEQSAGAPAAANDVPCPFCGETKDIEISEEYDEDYPLHSAIYFCECVICGCRGPVALDPESAVAAWEHRLEQMARAG